MYFLAKTTDDWRLDKPAKMLYVFLVNTGTMLTFEMNFAMQWSVVLLSLYSHSGVG